MDRLGEFGIEKVTLSTSFIIVHFCTEPRVEHDMLLQWKNVKGHVIRVTTEKDNSPYPVNPICRISLHHVSLLNNSTGRLVITRLKSREGGIAISKMD